MIVTAIIPAAGMGLRLKASLPKPLVKIAGKPILARTLMVLAENSQIKRIIIAVNKAHLSQFKAVLNKFRIGKKTELVPGGPSRRDSVKNCLKNVPADTGLILVHDAVRPFVSGDLIQRLLKEAQTSPAVISGVPVKATIKSVKVSRSQGDKRGFIVEKTLDRDKLWEIQTPQVFRKELLLRAYKKYPGLAVTDDASLVEKLGVKIKLIYGSYFNIKITTPEDLLFAEAILKSGYV